MINNNLYFLDIPENNNKFLIEFIRGYFDQNLIYPYDNCDDLFKNVHKDYLNLNKYQFFHGKFGFGFHKNIDNCNIITSLKNPISRAEKLINKIFKEEYKGFKINQYEKFDILDLIEKNKNLFSNVQTKFLALNINPIKLNFENIRLRTHKFLYESWPKFIPECTSDIFEKACNNLSNFLFFGLAEDHDGFIFKLVRLMNFKFNWQICDCNEKYQIYKKFKKNDDYEINENHHIAQILKIDNNITEYLNYINQFDIALYNFAKNYYEKNFKKIKFYM